MQKLNPIQKLLAQTDIYLIDQIMKGRYETEDKLLDAGCGTGRNMHWFLQNNFDITGIDNNQQAIQNIRATYPGFSVDKFIISTIENMPFPDRHFDHIICSAVLHFANSTVQFHNMMAELTRVLKPTGSLFIRMTSDIGIENKAQHIADGVYLIPDGSKRFLLTRTLLAECLPQNKLSFIEPLKTVNVDDIRCMSTLVLRKE